MANQQVGSRPRRHRRQTLQKLQRLEQQFPRAVVPRRLQLERDAAVTPRPEALLREGRAQAAQALQRRSIVRRRAQERLQMFADHPVEHGVLGVSRSIHGRHTRHAPG